jgi:hypothetical protein
MLILPEPGDLEYRPGRWWRDDPWIVAGIVYRTKQRMLAPLDRTRQLTRRVPELQVRRGWN